MSYKLTITVTKEILEKSKMCGVKGQIGLVSENCAIALAIRDIFPNAKISLSSTSLVMGYFGKNVFGVIDHPNDMTEYIKLFDSTFSFDRPHLPEASFEIDIPDAVIDTINIDSIKPLLINHPTLKLEEVYNA